ncbi:MAG: hypothetical protein AABY13_02020, partial [Nanoarchaeota archaeon]
PEIVLVGKALVTLEATCRVLDPDFNLVAYGLGHFKEIPAKELRAAFSPAGVRSRLRSAHDSLATFSEDALAIMDRFKRGTVHVDIQDTDIRHLGADMNASSNRLSYAMVISALLVFSALVIRINPLVGGVSVFSVAGVGAAIVTLLVLLVSIAREGKKGIDSHT